MVLLQETHNKPICQCWKQVRKQFGGTITLIYNLFTDLAVTTMFLQSPMFCVKETVVQLLQGFTQMIHCLVQ